MLREFMNKQSNYTIYTPNEIFEDLLNSDIKPNHYAFTYTYYFTISYLYRHAAYHYITPTIEDLKVHLGLNSEYKPINYIIKKGGVLDKLGYTESTTNYPISHYYNEDDFIEFEYVKEQPDQIRESYLDRHNNRYSIRVPLKMLSRDALTNPNNLDGTLYQTINTHATELSVANYMLSNSELGYTAFYIYQFLKYKCDESSSIGLEGYRIDYERFSEMVGLSVKTINKYINLMKKYNCLEVEKGNSFLKVSNHYFLKNFSKFR